MLLTILLVAVAILVAPATLAQYAEGAGEGEWTPLAGAPDKFEGGFYEKVWGLIQESADAGDSIARHDQGGSQKHADADNSVPYHHVIIQVSGDDDEEIRLNKASLVKRLEAAGAHDIVPADVLSFVTAYVPVTEIPGISLFGEVHLLGDGSIPTVSQMSKARGTISATAADLAGLSDGTIDGSGVTVAVIDFGINHINLNPKVDARIYCPTGSCEIDGGNNNSTLTSDQLDDLLSSSVTHGTIVANVIAASGVYQYNGIAPGVRLLDGYSPTRGEVITALDWAITNGADVAQISLVLPGNTCISSYILNNAINQAVSEGMVVVSAAGNDGSPEGAFEYSTVREPSCAQNVISVGGINDRTATPTLYDNSSLGPVTHTVPRLVPHLTTPAYGITLWSTSTSSTNFATYSGTSVAAPMTSAAVAMTLQTNPNLSPAETKSLLLLGTDWTGPVPCTSTQYETSNATDHCSYAAQRNYFADHTLETLNHVGFGILDVARSLGYAADSSSHVISSSFDSSTRTYLYGLNVTEPLDQAKVTLTWLVPFLYNYNAANFDFTVTCPGLDRAIRAESDHQTVEFAVFEPAKAGVCAVKVSAVTGSQDFTLASTYPLGPAPSEFAESDIVISAEDGTYAPNDTIEITMKFPRAVSVQGSSQPYLKLDMSGTTRHATYTGTNTDGTTLSFEYVVQDGDVATDLSYTGTDAVVVPAGSSLTDAHTGVPVRPVLPAPGDAGSLSGEHNIVVTPSTNTDNINPRLGSIERYNPTNATTDSPTLTFKATFSENVTEVDADDFVLSPDSAGGGGNTDTSTSTEQFTQTRSPNLAIPDLQTVTDSITVTGSGTATSVSVSVDITHTWIGDLKIDIIAPDDTTKTLHNRSGNSDDDIDKTYTPNFDGVLIAGAWKLQISDNANSDLGTLNSWTLTVNSGSSTTTVSPITGISGSGDTYYVAVSSTTDGAYNLDLASSGHNIKDTANNPLTNTAVIGADETYTVSTAVADSTNPRLESIKRDSPTSHNTNSQTLTYEIIFNEDVTGVGASDFVLSPNSPGGTGGVASVSGSGDTYYVTVSSTVSGAYNLDLVSSGHGIKDTANNPLTNVTPTGDDETYNVTIIITDSINPRLSSIERYDPSNAVTDSQTLTFKATFSENVTDVTSSDFVLSSDSADAGTDTSAEFTQTRTPNLAIPDLQTVTDSITVTGSGTATSVSVSVDITHTWIGDLLIELVAPDGTTKILHDRAGNYLDDIIKTYDPNFDGVLIAGVWTLRINDNYDADPGVLNSWTLTVNSGSSTTTVSPITGISGSGDTYYVAVSSTTDGAYNLDLVSSGHNIKDTANNPLTNTAVIGADETYTVSTAVADSTNPRLESIKRDDPSSAATGSQTLTYEIIFNEDVTGVGASDFVLSPNSPEGTGGVASVSGSGDTYYVTVSSTVSGAYNLDLVSSGHGIKDAANNPLTNTSPTTGIDQTYNVTIIITDSINPRLSSIERYDPSNAVTDSQTLTFKATFSENVTDVTSSDFILSSDSADAGTDTSAEFTQTRTPNLAIPDLQTVTDSITVTGSGTATSVSVSVDITHTWIGDLLIELVAPDGTTKILHDRAGNYLDDIIKTYDPNFDGVLIAGVWTLRINDNYDADPGVLNSWTLTVNSGSSTTTVSPITGISGSGDTYYVAVSSTTDGAYNLDLVSSGHNIKDTANNPLTNTAVIGADETYTVSTAVADSTNPRLESIKRDDPSSAATGSQTLTYEVTFSEDVTGVTSSDFALSSGSPGGTGGVASVSGSGDTYYVTVSSTVSGAYNLDLVSSGHGIKDTANNPLTNVTPTGDDETYNVTIIITDSINPRLSSIERYDPSNAVTDSQTLTFKATFSENVTDVTSSDFILSSDSADAGTDTSAEFTQTRTPNLAIPDLQTVTDSITVTGSGTATSVSVSVDITHTWIGDLLIELVAPDGTTKILHDRAGNYLDDIIKTYDPNFDGVLIAGVWTLRINDNYDADPGVLNSWTLTVNSGSSTTTVSPITGISGSGDTYYVAVSSTTDGAYNLDLVSSGHNIKDTANNPLTNTAVIGADETYTVSTAVADSTNPRLESIKRDDPSSAATGSQTLTYEVTFSEDVTGVTSSDFALSSGSPGGTGGVASVSGSGDTYYVTVSSTVSGAYNLDLVSSGHGIKDTANNPLTNTSPTTGIDQTYNVSIVDTDSTNPRLESIKRDDPSSAATGSQTLTYEVTFSEDVTGVTSSDFALSSGSPGGTGGVASISGSGDTYYVTVSSTVSGTYNLDLVSSGHGIKDAANNPLTNTSPTTGIDQTYNVSIVDTDSTNPRLESIKRDDPSSAATGSQTLTYEVTFSEDVTGVTSSDFALSSGSPGGTGGVASISGSGDTYYVTVSSTVSGTYNLDLVSSGHGIKDAANNPLTNTSPTTGIDQTYNVSIVDTDSTNPRLESIKRDDPSSAATGSQTLTYEVTFSEDVTGVTSSDFALSSGSPGGTGGVASISGSGDTYYVTVSSTVSGTYNLDLVSSGHGIKDAANNPLTNVTPTGADQSYTVSIAVAGTAPTIVSIERYYPTTEDTNLSTLIFKVTFSKDVTGVTTSDFVLSSASTGGTYDGTNPVVGVAGNGSTYNVVVRSQLSGTYNVDLVSSGHNIVDTDGNPLVNATPTTGTDHTYTVN